MGVQDVLSLGEKLAKLRDERKWTLAFVANATGMSVSHVSAVENGKRLHPSFQMVAALARLYGVPLQSLAPDHPLPAPAEAVPTMVRDSAPQRQLTKLYSPETIAFLSSESAVPYVAFAQKLAEAGAEIDTSTLLEWIAEFVRKPSSQYKPKQPAQQKKNRKHPG